MQRTSGSVYAAAAHARGILARRHPPALRLPWLVMISLTQSFRSILLGACVALLPGCVQFGPKFIEASRTDYNIAMNRTENEQMLLNLVRLRYGDAPYFLEASALNTQFLFAPSAEASSAFDFDGNNSYGVKGRLAYEEKPTVTYAPLRGQEFVRQVLSRVSLDTVLLLDASGWSTERVLRVCVERLNRLDNAARASGPTPSEAPVVAGFRRAIELFAAFEAAGDVLIYREPDGERERTFARFTETARTTTEFSELADLLDLDASLDNFELTFNQVADNKQTINFQTRSFMGVMYFLAQSVTVPVGDVDAGHVMVTKDAGGGTFDWNAVTGGLMRIGSSVSNPRAAAVSVRYRGSWFYIDDSDLPSKSTFALLGQLYALQSDADNSGAPILTLPIGG